MTLEEVALPRGGALESPGRSVGSGSGSGAGGGGSASRGPRTRSISGSSATEDVSVPAAAMRARAIERLARTPLSPPYSAVSPPVQEDAGVL